MSISNNEQKPNFNSKKLLNNYGWLEAIASWEYRDEDTNLLGYAVRYEPINPGDKKGFACWHLKNNKWSYTRWPTPNGNSVYKCHELKEYPNKPVLIVEGEKTADAAALLLPDYVVVTWVGGSSSAKKLDTTNLIDREIYIWPDNDKAGYKAQSTLKEVLLPVARAVYCINPASLGVDQGWDLADYNIEHSVIDLDMILMAIEDAKNIKQEFESIPTENFPDLSEKDNPLNTTDNIAHLLNHFNIKIKYNLMTNLPEFNNGEKKFSSENEADCFFTEISNLCVKNRVPKIDLYNHINLISERNRYHPAIEFIESKAWDGISRINDLLDTIESPKQELANKLIYRWLVSCVAALYLPDGIASEGALVLQGKQKIGKTYWLLKLLPTSHRNLVKEGVSISVTNKDDVIKATNVWIAELGEIESTFKKSDVNELKNFITSSYDEYRAPFGRFSKKFLRRTVFYGSVNSQHFLADETGNRRFWTVPVTHINYDHTINMQQLWAEIKVLYDEGETYRLTPSEQDLLNKSNQDHECINPLKELLFNNYYWESLNKRWMTPTQIIQEMDLIPDKLKTNNLANILREENIESRKSNRGTQYLIPYEKAQNSNY